MIYGGIPGGKTRRISSINSILRMGFYTSRVTSRNHLLRISIWSPQNLPSNTVHLRRYDWMSLGMLQCLVNSILWLHVLSFCKALDAIGDDFFFFYHGKSSPVKGNMCVVLSKCFFSSQISFRSQIVYQVCTPIVSTRLESFHIARTDG